MKISFIGAGSIGFTQTLVRDLLKVPEFHNAIFSFHDISEKNLNSVSQLVQKDIDQNKLPAKIEQSIDRKKSLEGAKYIINCTRIGGLEAYEHDINIPLQYGVDQCVGDTICAGGILYGHRISPQTLNFCRDIKSYSESNALFLNYSNPMAMNTWAAISEAKVNTVGLCHGVQGGAKLISKVLGSNNDEDLQLIGIDKTVCSALKMNFMDGEINDITFLNAPIGDVYPEDELPINERTLKGFTWRKKERPETLNDLFDKNDKEDQFPSILKFKYPEKDVGITPGN